MNTLQYLEHSQEIYWNILKVDIKTISSCKLVCTGINTPWMNGVIEDALDATKITTSIAEVVQYYKEKDLPFSWWVEEKRETGLIQQELVQHSLVEVGSFEGMSVNIDEMNELGRIEDFKIQVVSNPKSLKEFVAVLIESYEASAELETSVIKLFENAGLNFPIFHFLGKYRDVPVSVGSLFIHEGTAGIYHVGTVPSARKQGFASFLTYTALKHAKYHSCKASFLTASPMAQNLYKKLGFKNSNRMNLFMTI